MSFQNKGELEKAAHRLTAPAFRCVRSGCSPAEPDYFNHNCVGNRSRGGDIFPRN